MLKRIQKKENRLLKKTLCMIFAGFCVLSLLTGCSSYKYLGSDTKELKLRCEGYTVQVPESSETQTLYNSDYWTIKMDDKTEIHCIVSSNTNPDSVAKYVTLSNIRGYYSFDRSNVLGTLYTLTNETSFKDEFKETEVDEYSAMIDNGTFKDSEENKIQYVSYEFFLDDDKKVPCEVFVCSDDLKTDELKTAAQEIIDSISVNSDESK